MYALNDGVMGEKTCKFFSFLTVESVLISKNRRKIKKKNTNKYLNKRFGVHPL